MGANVGNSNGGRETKFAGQAKEATVVAGEKLGEAVKKVEEVVGKK